MKVLFVISSLNTGGAQRALSNIVTHLPDGWEIDILLNNTENIVYPYNGNLIDLGVHEPKNRNSVLYQFKVLVKRFFALRKLKKMGHYNACVSFLDSANIANVVTGKKYCKTIVSVRNFLSHNKSFAHKCIHLVIKVFYNRADCIVAVSEVIKDDLVRNLGMRKDIVTAIYNGYPLDEIRSRAGEREAGSLFTFITAGRFEQQKGQWHLMRAFAELVKKHENSRLVILGEGSYMEYFKKLAGAYDIEEKVSLTGFIDNPYRELNSADVFVFPSLYEGFPNAMLEAMICGLPVIASDFRSGAREILAPGTDIFFEQTSDVELAEFGIITPVCSGEKHTSDIPLDPQELLLLEAMELVYSDTDIRQRYCLASEKRAEDFSIEESVKQWRSLLSR